MDRPLNSLSKKEDEPESDVVTNNVEQQEGETSAEAQSSTPTMPERDTQKKTSEGELSHDRYVSVSGKKKNRILNFSCGADTLPFFGCLVLISIF
jgi:hypothetical protein